MTIAMRALVVALLSTLVGMAHAAEGSAERERIATERAAAKARLAEQERSCREQFVVTACVEAAQREERATLTRLRRAEQVLDDAQRREAAARRRQSIQERGAGQAARASAAAASEPQHRTEPRPAPAPHPVLPARGEPAPVDQGARRAAEQRNEAEFNDRARAARAHRDEVEKRNAARAASGKAAAPLAAPSGASAP